MPSVSIRWERRAYRELEALPRDVQQRIVRAVEGLIDTPLKGQLLTAEWKGRRRLRVGNYRVVYAFDGAQLLIAVVRVAHRKEAYR